jgi:hypothetical protein
MKSDARPPLRSVRLIDQLRERIRYCHYSLKTEKAYVPSPLESLPDVNSVREVSPQYGSRYQLIAAAGARFDYGSLRPPMNR